MKLPRGILMCARMEPACRRARGRFWTVRRFLPKNAPSVMAILAKRWTGGRFWPGGQGTLEDMRPVKTIGSYWPYLSTVFDYVHRAMPFGEAQSLEADETYAIVAYLLYVNDLVDEDFVLSRANFTEQKLPNEANFFLDDRGADGGELESFTAPEICMQNCKADVKITARAAIIDVTPEDGEARKAREAKQATEEAGEQPEAAPEPEVAQETALDLSW